ncbi:dUTP diphosphatase [Chlamydiota bacterium]
MKKIQVNITQQESCSDLPLPRYMSDFSSGLDLYAAVDLPVTLEPGQRRLIKTGIHIEIPYGYEAQVRPRSGLALKHGISIVNTPGTIDADYRGEIGIILINLGDEPFRISRGDRIAQLIFQEVVQAQLSIVPQLNETARASGGFGHTGV